MRISGRSGPGCPKSKCKTPRERGCPAIPETVGGWSGIRKGWITQEVRSERKRAKSGRAIWRILLLLAVVMANTAGL